MRVVLILLLFNIVANSTSAQEVQHQFDQHIQLLCSDSLAGRGYVENGDKKTAQYIKSQFQLHNIVPVKNTYFQPFELWVNVFDSNAVSFSTSKNISSFTAGDGLKERVHSFNTGYDYIIKSCSKPIEGKFQVQELDHHFFTHKKSIRKFLKDKYFLSQKENTALLYDQKNLKASLPSELIRKIRSYPVLIEKTNTPLLSVSSSQNCQPTIVISDSSANRLMNYAYVKIQPKLIRYQTQNIIGMIEGKEKRDSFLIVCAHYDHLGKQGSAIFRGANDNASGVAAMLTLATHFSKPENKPRYSMLFIAFGAEEAGLVGSQYYVESPLVPLQNTKFVLNLDLLGSGSQGITVVNGTEYPILYDRLCSSKKDSMDIKKRTPAPNSDHYPFYLKGVPSFFIYARGKVGGYHHVNDVPKKLEQNQFENLYNLLTTFLRKF